MTAETACAARRAAGPVPGPVRAADADAWCALERELGCWRAAGRSATMWWRDDDAAAACPALERLLALAAAHCVPVALAVIPARLDASLAPLLGRFPQASALQHGYAHADHAAADEPSAELGAHRPAAQVLDELGRGRSRLAAALGARFEPVLVPPWNRIDAALVPALPALGLHGLSCFAPRAQGADGRLPVRANCHVDPVDWRAGGAFRGAARTLSSLTAHLRARREGRVDPGEPTGLLTHHWRHDAATWDFLGLLLGHLHAGGARWLHARRVFAP